MRNLITILLCLFAVSWTDAQVSNDRSCSKQLSCFALESAFHFAFNLRTQYRYVTVTFSEHNDTLTFHWSRQTDEGLRSGAFSMSKQSRDHATRLCYIMPSNDETIVTPDNELFCLLSRDALLQLKATGTCRYNHTTLALLKEEGNSSCSGLPAGVSLLHVKDFDEGYEMWIEDNPDFPLIHKMLNNPVEIDWYVE